MFIFSLQMFLALYVEDHSHMTSDFQVGRKYGEDFSQGFDTQNYPKLQASLGTQPENTHGIKRQTQPNPYPWIFSGNTLGYPWVPTLNFYPWVPWVPA